MTGVGEDRTSRHAVMVPFEGRAARVPQRTQDLDALGQPRHPHPGRIHRDAGLLVVRRHPAGTEPELEASAGDDVERGRLLGEHDRVAEVVVEHERTDAKRRRGLRRNGECHHRRPLVVEVIGHVEGGVAEILGLASQFAPRTGGCRMRRLQGEAEGGHGGRSYGVNLLR